VYITTPFKYRQFRDNELTWHYSNLEAMQKYGYKYEFYDIIGKSISEIEHDLAKYQTMYVEGGSAFFFMQEAYKNNFGDYVKKRLKYGMIYISESAGSVCAGIDIAANSRPGKSLENYDLPSSAGFGIVNFAILPHWGQQEKRDDYFTYKIPQAYKEDFPYILLTNNQYVEVTEDWYKIVDVAHN
jgi:dipeptidase E